MTVWLAWTRECNPRESAAEQKAAGPGGGKVRLRVNEHAWALCAPHSCVRFVPHVLFAPLLLRPFEINGTGCLHFAHLE